MADAAIRTTEIFGPVITVQRFGDEDEAVRIANDTLFGLGASVHKLSYLPEAHTDFIMAVIAEELGGALVVEPYVGTAVVGTALLRGLVERVTQVALRVGRAKARGVRRHPHLNDARGV